MSIALQSIILLSRCDVHALTNNLVVQESIVLLAFLLMPHPHHILVWGTLLCLADCQHPFLLCPHSFMLHFPKLLSVSFLLGAKVQLPSSKLHYWFPSACDHDGTSLPANT